jgi:cystathionine beta-synthase
VSRAIELMRKEAISQIPVTHDGALTGLLTEQDLLEFLTSGQKDPRIRLIDVMSRSVPTVHHTTPLASLDEMLEITGSVVVVDAARHPLQILTKIDLVEWLLRH